MNRLFMLRVRKRGPVLNNEQGKPYYFAVKSEAKVVRNSIKAKDDKSTVVVSYGPDHRLFKGE